MKSSLRQRKYKRFLYSEEELCAKRSDLEIQILPLKSLLNDKNISAAEIAARYIINFLKIMRPKDYLGGPHHQISCERPLPYSVEIFMKHSLRAVPLAVNHSIVEWYKGEYSLHLIDYIPTAREILELQSRGERVVTCFFKPQELIQHVHGERDPLGFVLHDLIHAHHFFYNRDWRKEQIDFYSELLHRWDAGEFDDQIKMHPQFEDRFHYVISDMNSHPQHLRQTLSAIMR